MTSDKEREHFVTLFDSHYLPQGLSLYKSLEAHGQPFTLWIVALDELCAVALEKIAPKFVRVLRLPQVETQQLVKAKQDRSVAEYCWTLTPFLPSAVFERQPELERVTYLDADLFFLDRPLELIEEFLASGKHVLLTEHAFADEYADKARYGRFCVQFMTFRNTEPGLRVLRWWQDRCLEWCYAREEDGKFGDQKYLDAWPEMFRAEIHILRQTQRTLAPWNVASVGRRLGRVSPVFYHFHSLRIVGPTRVVLYVMYSIGRRNRWIYDRYIATMRDAVAEMRARDIPVIGRPLPVERFRGLRYLGRWLSGRMAWANL